MRNGSLVTELRRQTPSNVHFAPGRVSLLFDGRRLAYRVATGRARNHVGEWHRRKRLLLLDEEFDGVDAQAILLHEAVEKYVAQQYDLDVDSQAHCVAEAIERRWLRRRHRNWRSHQMRVWWMWRKRGSK